MEDENKHFSGLSVVEAWKLRRRVLYAILLFTAALILWSFKIPAKELTDGRVDVIQGLLTLCGWCLFYWFIGSVADDNGVKILDALKQKRK